MSGKVIRRWLFAASGIPACAFGCFAQALTPQQYVEQFRDMAIANMKSMGVPASITLAQGMLESGNGNSRLAVEGNNHFGIKCHSDWNGEMIREDDDEKAECFRKYRTVLDSYRDHAEFLRGKRRYAFLFEIPVTDYRRWAHGLKEAGYATNPQYAGRLIRIIEEHRLYEYDRQGGGGDNGTVAAEHGGERRKAIRRRTPAEGSEIIAGISPGRSRKVLYANNVPYVVAGGGDTFYAIASDFEMEIWQVYRYNDLGRDGMLKEGDRVYIKPKRRKGQEEHHIVTGGETMHGIAQQHGIKLRHLYRINSKAEGSTVRAGEKLALRRQRR